jgi:glycosyltransferase involved in cell wall biosynthesis
MISVAVCTYNGEKYIEEQLKSIQNQTLPVDEIIVCDDFSKDNTVHIIEELQLNDSRIKLFKSKRNLGTLINFEKAISRTKGDIIFLSDQDDIWHADKVEKMIDYFNNNSKCLMLFTDGNLVDENGNQIGSTLWKKWKFDEYARKKWKNNSDTITDLIQNINYVTGATVAFKSELKSHIFPFETPVRYWHDAWIALNAAYLGGLYCLEMVTIDYRIHAEQLIGINTQNNTVDKKHISLKKFKNILYRKFPEYSDEIAKLPQEKSFLNRLTKQIRKYFINFHT